MGRYHWEDLGVDRRVIVQGEQRVPVHLLEVGYSECTYSYNKCWKWPLWAWEYVTEVTYAT